MTHATRYILKGRISLTDVWRAAVPQGPTRKEAEDALDQALASAAKQQTLAKKVAAAPLLSLEDAFDA